MSTMPSLSTIDSKFCWVISTVSALIGKFPLRGGSSVLRSLQVGYAAGEKDSASSSSLARIRGRGDLGWGDTGGLRSFVREETAGCRFIQAPPSLPAGARRRGLRRAVRA